MVFITSQQGNQKKNEGLCMVCAKELNIPQISEYMKHMGITDEELEQTFSQQIEELAAVYDYTGEKMRAVLKKRFDGYHFS